MTLIRTGLKKLGSMLLSITAEAQTPDADAKGKSPRKLGEVRKASATSVVAGSIQFLGMTEIKRRLGAQWNAVADIASSVAEQTIKRYISAEDAYQRHGADAFVLCFASPDKAHAEAKTRAIAEEISAALARQAPQAGFRIDHTVAEMKWADIDNGEADLIAEQIAKELRQVRERAEASARAWRNELIRSAGVRFSPIWHPSRRTVTCYRAMLNEQTGTHALQRLSGITSPRELRSTLHELDCLVIGRAIKALDGLLQAGGMAQVLVPVNFNSLCDRTAREKYLNLCRDIPEHYQRLIMFEVHGAPHGTPVSRLIEVALTLKLFGQGVLVELPASSGRLQELASVRLLGLSVDAKSLSREGGQGATALTRLVAAAAALNLKVFVHGADTVGSLDAAQKARADYVDGRAVAMPLAEPKTAYHWSPH
jgi:EAL domain-containing protein (putative c-di-GMP-specific phosphodiesterase class I)